MKRFALPTLIVGGVMFAVLSAGCATRGYVRSQVGEARTQIGQQVDQVQRDLATVRNSVDQAQARADQAFSAAGESRDLALGKLGYHEVTQATVNFAFNSDKLDEKSEGTLDGLTQEIVSRPELLVDVYGFTDRTGSEEYNFGLGLRRAQAVERYLVDKTPDQLVRYAAISYGKTKPLGDQSTRESRADNRRVVISLIERVPPTAGSAEIQQNPPEGQPMGQQSQSAAGQSAGQQTQSESEPTR